jgi:hypothetical protein
MIRWWFYCLKFPGTKRPVTPGSPALTQHSATGPDCLLLLLAPTVILAWKPPEAGDSQVSFELRQLTATIAPFYS